ncbi:abortive infection protein [Mycobacterium sp. GA-1841]|uniref:CPBP family intramembrane glutamic endopeptidase n=1 Tax=Mycobacterium sp. GA-1841 TaxID=1834154 RepID=UPI00096BD65F|nr:CPBP family intramembrane glutamic endopeptidase [Mycobacterium sp. GA-1841]OMC29971.1 abortive infection protein [Mycobacterium sp. GA-1841]
MTNLLDLMRTSAVAPQESPSVIRRRRRVVVAVLILGAVLLGVSLTRRPGDPSFYWLTFGLAATWAGGALLSGPLHLGTEPWGHPHRRPAVLGIVTGVLLGAAFVVGALVAREIDVVAALITRVLAFAQTGSLPLIVTITLVNGVAEELFFRGALYSALSGHRPVLLSTLLYIVATSASGNPMLGFAAVILGTACAWERRVTGGVLAPVLTHLVWGLVMVLALPPLFGL